MDYTEGTEATEDTEPYLKTQTSHLSSLRVLCGLRALCGISSDGPPLTRCRCFATFISVETEMIELSDIQQRFVLHWGEMGARWGVNRTVAQIHALLYLSSRPLHAEEVAATLQVARSNVSTSMRELQGWGLARVVHVMGDRRDHFETLQDPWAMLRVILDQRKAREIDPTLDLLRELADEAEQRGDTATREKLVGFRDLLESLTGWYTQVRKLPLPALVRFVKLGRKIPKAVGATK